MKINKSKPNRFFLPLIIASTALVAGGAYLLGSDKFQTDEPVVVNETIVEDIGEAGSLEVDGAIKTYSKQARLQAKPKQTVKLTAEPVNMPSKANAAAFSWNQSGEDGVLIEVRTKNSGKWSTWTELEVMNIGKDGVETSGTASAIVLADNIDDFQFRSTLTGSEDKASAAVSFAESDIVGIDSSQGPDGSASLLDKIGANLAPNTSAMPNSPNIISRGAWGSPEPNWSSWKPEYAPLSKVIVHHTATTESSNSYADVRAIWHYHARTLGWGDIGYHYLVDSKGRIFEGRYYDKKHSAVHREEVVGGHAYGNNVGTIGVSAIGNYENQTLTLATREAMSRIIGYKLAPYRINPASPGVVLGHYQVGPPTACPGRNIKSQFSTLISVASQRYNSYLARFPFQPMSAPRVMEVKADTYKLRYPSRNNVDAVLKKGRHIRLHDKVTSSGKTYLRTYADTANSQYKMIDLGQLIDITPTPIAPVQLEAKKTQRYVNPTRLTTSTQSVKAGDVDTYNSSITVSGVTYYRSATDTAANRSWFIPQSNLVQPGFKPFLSPRWMQIQNNTTLINPLTGETSSSIEAGQQFLFDSKITVDQDYYRSAELTKSDSPYAIRASDITDIPYVNFETPYRTMALNQSTDKYLPARLRPVAGTTLSPSANPQIRLRDQITVNGRIFYRTLHDSGQGLNRAIPAEAFTEIEYEPFSVPREMTTVRATSRLDPVTGVINQTVPIDQTTKYTSKIYVSGVWYARTEADTATETPLAIRLSDLR